MRIRIRRESAEFPHSLDLLRVWLAVLPDAGLVRRIPWGRGEALFPTAPKPILEITYSVGLSGSSEPEVMGPESPSSAATSLIGTCIPRSVFLLTQVMDVTA